MSPAEWWGFEVDPRCQSLLLSSATEFLQHQLDGLADQVHAIADAERVQQLGYGRL